MARASDEIEGELAALLLLGLALALASILAFASHGVEGSLEHKKQYVDIEIFIDDATKDYRTNGVRNPRH